VSDDGIGIAAGHQSRIFQPFAQVDGSASRKYGGSGLGLAIVKDVVEAHGGHVSVESIEGQGATFRFTLRKAGHATRKRAQARLVRAKNAGKH